MGLIKQQIERDIRERVRAVVHTVINVGCYGAPHPGFSDISRWVVERVRPLDIDSLVGTFRRINMMTGSEVFPWA